MDVVAGCKHPIKDLFHNLRNFLSACCMGSLGSIFGSWFRWTLSLVTRLENRRCRGRGLGAFGRNTLAAGSGGIRGGGWSPLRKASLPQRHPRCPNLGLARGHRDAETQKPRGLSSAHRSKGRQALPDGPALRRQRELLLDRPPFPPRSHVQHPETAHAHDRHAGQVAPHPRGALPSHHGRGVCGGDRLPDRVYPSDLTYPNS